jgi:hypothetical protein
MPVISIDDVVFSGPNATRQAAAYTGKVVPAPIAESVQNAVAIMRRSLNSDTIWKKEWHLVSRVQEAVFDFNLDKQIRDPSYPVVSMHQDTPTLSLGASSEAFKRLKTEVVQWNPRAARHDAGEAWYALPERVNPVIRALARLELFGYSRPKLEELAS